jgi:hypothetical protein
MTVFEINKLFFKNFFLTKPFLCLKINSNLILDFSLNNLSMILKRVSLVAGLMIVVMLISTAAGAGEEGLTFRISGRDFYLRSDLSNNDSGSILSTGRTGLIIPLAGSLSLDLSLSSVNTGQAIPGTRPFDAPPIPVTRPGESDLRLYRLGADFSFRF